MSIAATAPLNQNEHVQELLSILKANGKDASALTAMIGYIGSMENQLNRAAEELQGVVRELNTMREERNHPLRTALQNAAQSMEADIAKARTQLEALKAKVIEGCKQAVAAFKEKGISVLNSIAKFFKIKPALQSLRQNLKNDIKKDQQTISKIKAISTQYHKAGRQVRNFGRVLRGKKPIPGVKPNGRLAKLAAAPFQAEIKSLTGAVKDIDKAISALTRLEKAAPKRATPAQGKGDKPSTLENMRQLQAKLARDKKEAPAADKSKRKEEAAL